MENIYKLIDSLKPDYVKLRYCPKFKERNEFEIDIKNITKKKIGKIIETYEIDILGVGDNYFQTKNKLEKTFYKKRTYMFKDIGILLVELFFTIEENHLPYLSVYPIMEKHIIEKYSSGIELIDKKYISYNVLSLKNIMEEIYEFIHLCDK